MTISSLGFVPYLRPGAALLTAVAFQHQLAGMGSTNLAKQAIYGARHGKGKNYFGYGVSEVVDRVFAGSLTAQEVLERHTLYGVYARGLTAKAGENWASRILCGGGEEFVPRMRRSSTTVLSCASPDLRSCRDCVSDDVDRYGLPSWDVLHLVPAIHHCPKHGTLLRCEASARGRTTWPIVLPTGNPTAPPSGPAIPPSDGYAHYLRLWQDLFEGKVREVAWDRWACFMEHACAIFGTAEAATKSIEKSLEATWGVGCRQIAEHLGVHIAPNFVASELTHTTTAARIAQKLVMLTGLARLGILADKSKFEGQQIDLTLTSSERSESDLGAQLRSELLNAGISISIVKALIVEATECSAIRAARVTISATRKAIDCISMGLLERMDRTPGWSEKSWVKRALWRRGRKGLLPSYIDDEPIQSAAKEVARNRRRLGLSRRQLGKLIGVGEAAVYKWENGHSQPRRRHLQKIVELRSLRSQEVHKRLVRLRPSAQRRGGS